MIQDDHLLVFSLDSQRYALHLAAVVRIVRAVEITLLPRAPDIVMGAISVHGNIIPVINIRRRFRLPERDLIISDHLVIASTKSRRVALIVDSVAGVMELSGKEIVSPEKIVPGTQYVKGVVKLEDGLVLIHDLDQFLSLDEERALDTSLNERWPSV